MIFLIWQTIETWVSGAAIREVDCEYCGNHFAYEITAEADGYGTVFYGMYERAARNRAQAAAERKLARLLANTVVPYPCPHCGRYQSKMIAKLARLHYPTPWSILAARGLILASIGVYALLSGFAVLDCLLLTYPDIAKNAPAAGMFLGIWLVTTTVAVIWTVIQRFRRSRFNPTPDIAKDG